MYIWSTHCVNEQELCTKITQTVDRNASWMASRTRTMPLSLEVHTRFSHSSPSCATRIYYLPRTEFCAGGSCGVPGIDLPLRQRICITNNILARRRPAVASPSFSFNPFPSPLGPFLFAAYTHLISYEQRDVDSVFPVRFLAPVLTAPFKTPLPRELKQQRKHPPTRCLLATPRQRATSSFCLLSTRET